MNRIRHWLGRRRRLVVSGWRRRPRLTWRGWLTGGAGLAALLAGMVAGGEVPVQLGLFLLLTLVFSFFLCRRNLRGLTVAHAHAPDAFVGDDLWFQAVVSAPPRGGNRYRLELVDELEDAAAWSACRGETDYWPATVGLRLDELPSGGQAAMAAGEDDAGQPLPTSVRLRRRGLRREFRYVLSSAFPFGLFRHRVAGVVVRSLNVFPRPWLPKDWEERLEGGAGEEAGGPAPGPDCLGTFRGLREYAAGDSLRLVHWPLSARYGELVVKELEPSSPRATTVVFHSCQPPGRLVGGDVEEALGTLAGVCLHLASRGQEGELIASFNGWRKMTVDGRQGGLEELLASLARARIINVGGFSRLHRTVRRVAANRRLVVISNIPRRHWAGRLPPHPGLVWLGREPPPPATPAERQERPLGRAAGGNLAGRMRRLLPALPMGLGAGLLWYGLRAGGLPTADDPAAWLAAVLGMASVLASWLALPVGGQARTRFRAAQALVPGMVLALALCGATGLLPLMASVREWSESAWSEMARENPWASSKNNKGKTPASRSRPPPSAVGLSATANPTLSLDPPPPLAGEGSPSRAFLWLDQAGGGTPPWPFYLRESAFDAFTGGQWLSTEPRYLWREDGDDGEVDGWIQVETPVDEARLLRHGIFIPGQRSHALLTLPRPVAVGVPVLTGGPNDTLLIPVRPRQNIAYAVVSSGVVGGEVLARRLPVGKSGELFLAIPEVRYAARLRAEARRVVAGAPSPAAMVERLLAHVGREYAYVENPPPRTGAEDRLEEFVFTTKRGHCTMFASIFVLMLRAVDIPSRVVSGYHGGTLDERTGVYVFTDRDRHAWAEVFFEDFGWVTIDPTPASAQVRPQTVADSGFAAMVDSFTYLGEPLYGSGAPGLGRHARWRRWFGFILAAAFLVAFGVGWLVRRRSAWQAAVARTFRPRPRDRSFFAALCGHFGGRGCCRHPAQTPWEYFNALKRQGLADQRHEQMFDYVCLTRYGGVTPDQARERRFLAMLEQETVRGRAAAR